MKWHSASICSRLVVCIIALGAAMSYSQNYTITNGYVCDPKNPGGEETRIYYRQQDGLAINISPNDSFPIVCPVEIPFGDPPYEISLGVVNTGDASQRFACALEENDLAGTKTRTQGNAVTVPAGAAGLLAWQEVLLTDDYHYLSLRCILPPKGAVSWVEWF